MGVNVQKFDKVIAKKTITAFGVPFVEEGDKFEVIYIGNDMVGLSGINGRLSVDRNTFDNNFEKFVDAPKKVNVVTTSDKNEKINDFKLNTASKDDNFKNDNKYINDKPAFNRINNRVTRKMVDKILDDSEYIVDTLFDKCTMVSCKLPNGFVITETYSCVDPANYDCELGTKCCMDKIREKVWELEGYRLQIELYKAGYIEEDDDEVDSDDCENCPDRYTCDYYNYED